MFNSDPLFLTSAQKPNTHRIGNVLHCDKLPYPTNYVQHDIYCVVYVGDDVQDILKARYTINLLIESGRLTEDRIRLRKALGEYNFNRMIDGFLQEQIHTSKQG
ncbi:hypothetical protein EAG18_08315 [Pseudoalteromonas sp. J010]|uniref:hypothetical protein n=1 Tax=Pseudoalteromonas sp. J010 TaxID=998465 RepID=UPI000F64563D|nr:hypothetical protein [Pseudoalteromonas sp. J010]RRS09114.1 hypothetical protein EAG18_08315 [Pseudoalteromonas sp. J010]